MLLSAASLWSCGHAISHTHSCTRPGCWPAPPRPLFCMREPLLGLQGRVGGHTEEMAWCQATQGFSQACTRPLLAARDGEGGGTIVLLTCPKQFKKKEGENVQDYNKPVTLGRWPLSMERRSIGKGLWGGGGGMAAVCVISLQAGALF